MKLHRLVGITLSAFTVSLLVGTQTVLAQETKEPEVVASAAFPESNAFGLVVNGERNSMTVTVENKSDRNVTLVSIAGSLRHPDTDILMKNLTALKVGVTLLSKVPVRVPYVFHSEFKPGDLRLNIWLDNAVDNEKFQVVAYDSVVKIVEPEFSIFDFKMISTYLIALAFLGGIGYYAYLTLLPQPKKTRTNTATAQPSTPATATATGTVGYEEEWIADYHLKKTKTGKKKQNVASGTSGDEQSAGTEGRKMKGRK
ncbi:hypothetical protein JOM56_001218 [Amanita muscaria]